MFLPSGYYLLTEAYGSVVVFQRGVLCVCISLLLVLEALSRCRDLHAARKCRNHFTRSGRILATNCATTTLIIGAVAISMYAYISEDSSSSYNCLYVASLFLSIATHILSTITQLGGNLLRRCVAIAMLPFWALWLHSACVRLIVAATASQSLAACDSAIATLGILHATLSCTVPASIASALPRKVAMSVNDDGGANDISVPFLANEDDSQNSRHNVISVNGFSRGVCINGLNELFNTGVQQQLGMQNIPHLHSRVATEQSAQEFDASLHATPDFSGAIASSAGNRASFDFPSTLWSLYGGRWLLLGLLQLFTTALSFSGPLLLNELLSFLSSDADSGLLIAGFAYVIALCVSSIVSAILSTIFNVLALEIQTRLRAGITSAVFTAMLVGSAQQRASVTDGKITNFISVDVQQLMTAVTSVHQFWSLPIQVLVTLVLLYQQVKFAFFAGLGVLCFFVPVNLWISRRIGLLTREMMAHRDDRVRVTTELLKSIKLVKMYNWETPVHERIRLARSLEFGKLSARKYLDACCVYMWASTPLLVPLATLTAVVLSNDSHILAPSTLFTTIALLNMLIFPLNAYAWVVTGVLEARVSFRRLQQFLQPDPSPSNSFSIGSRSMQMVTQLPDRCIGVLRGTHGYLKKEDDGVYTVQPRINIPSPIHIPSQQVMWVFGSVGSGKTSLLRSLLGEMRVVDGLTNLLRNDTHVSYAAQSAWICEDTLQCNVLFGEPLDSLRLQRVIHACCLDNDIASFEHGVHTRISANTLSGGQKMRVALARALYSSSSLLLLDDPTAALDASVGDQVISRLFKRSGNEDGEWTAFDQGLIGFCQADKKTVIIASHDHRVRPYCDVAVKISQGVAEVVRPEELPSITLQNSTFQTSPTLPDHKMPSAEQENTSIEPIEAALRREGDAERREEGFIRSGVVAKFAKYAGDGLVWTVVGSLILMQLSKNVSDWYLSIWSAVAADTSSFLPADKVVISDLAGKSPHTLLLIYAGIVIANSVFTAVRSWSFARACLSACRSIHDKLLQSAVFAPCSFHTAPMVGRLINRLSADQFSTDDTLPFQLNIFLAQSVGLCGTLLVLGYTTLGLFLIFAVPLAIIYYRLQNVYRCTSREVKRLDSVTRSPLFAQFLQTLSGAETIRSFSLARFNAIGNEKHAMLQALDANQRTSFTAGLAAQWLSIRLQAIGATVLLLLSLLAVAVRAFSDAEAAVCVEGDCNSDVGGSSTSSTAGFALSYAIPIVSSLQGLLGAFSETEKEMIAVERAMEYIDVAPEQDPQHYIVSEVTPMLSSSLSTKTPLLQLSPSMKTPLLQTAFSINALANDTQAASTTFSPAIMLQVDRLTVSYDARSSPVLQNVSFSVLRGQRVGIGGRTGSGKSTLLAALWRLVAYSGSIHLDGVDTARMKLSALRQSLGIVPQDALLFEADVRFNLDPCNTHTDEELLHVLRAAGLYGSPTSKIQSLHDKIENGGRNFSVGERQLLCVCRAVSNKPKIMCLDEATASADADTEQQCMQLISSQLPDMTMLVISHRPAVLQQCDVIMLFENGAIIESGPPATLAAESTSQFARLLHASMHAQPAS